MISTFDTKTVQLGSKIQIIQRKRRITRKSLRKIAVIKEKNRCGKTFVSEWEWGIGLQIPGIFKVFRLHKGSFDNNLITAAWVAFILCIKGFRGKGVILKGLRQTIHIRKPFAVGMQRRAFCRLYCFPEMWFIGMVLQFHGLHHGAGLPCWMAVSNWWMICSVTSSYFISERKQSDCYYRSKR